jgi:Xaa-Pro aminopeptidase
MFEAQFQSFDDPQPAETAPRVQALRAELARRGFTGFILPRADRHQNEYVPPSDERLAWLTGFTGSAGTAIVLPERAVLFVDGRYTLQAGQQLDPAVFSIVHIAETTPERWLESNLLAGAKLGYDPWLHTVDGAERLSRACINAGSTLAPVEPDPIDAIWSDRPAPPFGQVSLHDLRFAGEYAASKIGRIRVELARLRADALVVSDPHALAWTFNIRGADIAHTPLLLAFAIIPLQGRPTIYVDGGKLSNVVRHKIEELAQVREPADFIRNLADLGRNHSTVRLDQATGADVLARIVSGAGGKIARGPDPIALMKAVKNPVEIEGAREAHIRDGAAVTRFLAWLDREAPEGALTEIDAVEALETFRRESGLLKDVSFPTIAGAGPDGAIVHYRPSRRIDDRDSRRCPELLGNIDLAFGVREIAGLRVRRHRDGMDDRAGPGIEGAHSMRAAVCHPDRAADCPIRLVGNDRERARDDDEPGNECGQDWTPLFHGSSCFCVIQLAFRFDERLLYCREGAREETHVVECLTRQRLGHIPRRFSVRSQHYNPGVVILHRQPPIVFRAAHFASVLFLEHKAPRDVAGTCDCPALDLRCLTCIDQHRRLVVADDVDDGVELDLAHAASGTPRRDSELIPADIRIPGIAQLCGKPPALAAVRPVAVEHQRRGLVAADQPPVLRDVRHVQRHRHTGLWRHIQRTGDVTDRELACGPHIQDGCASRQQDHLQRLGRDLARARGLPRRWTLGPDERGACHGNQHSSHESPNSHLAPHISLRCRRGC